MTWGVLNAAMLVGLLGAALPVIIHFLNRRRDPIVEWGAMQFLDLGRRARQRLRRTELLLMLARMGLLAAVALALARPFLAPSAARSGVLAKVGGLGAGAAARDVVLVVDGSASMDRASGGTTPRAQAVEWARQFVRRLAPGDSVAVLVAGDRVRPIVDPPSFDGPKVAAALGNLLKTPARGSSDLPAALAEAFRVLETARNPAREVVLLTDSQRTAWRPGETARWALVRDLHRRLPVAPRVWVATFGPSRPNPDDAPNGAVAAVRVSRSLVTPGLPLTVSAELTNAGPGPLTRTAELLVDGRPAPGTSQVVGPLPAGGRAPLSFDTSLASPGSHLLTVRLAGGDDPLPADDEASVAVEVAPALGVLLVDGEPGREPLTGETDFLRAALAPSGDDTPQARATVIAPDRLTSAALQDQQVVVLANVERLAPDAAVAVARFLDAGGGVLVAPGDRTDPTAWNALAWIPATLGAAVGDTAARTTVAHPAPATFSGPVLPPFSQGDAPPLAAADLFGYRKLAATAGASVSARLDTGDPWVVERPQGRGRAVMVAGPLDAEGGTLPVNPDFVPLVHELALHLAGGGDARQVHAGEPLVFDLSPGLDPGATLPATLPMVTPSGTAAQATVSRAGGRVRARFDDTVESGVYRLKLPDPPGGVVYATVSSDGREADMAPLDPAEAARLAEGWPLTFEPDPALLAAHLLDVDTPASRREVWRGLVLLALGGLCAELYLTRKLVRGQGLSVG